MRKPSQTRKPQLVRSESKEKLGGILNPAFNKPLIKEASKSERQLGELLEVFEPQISKKKSNSELIATTPDTKKIGEINVQCTDIEKQIDEKISEMIAHIDTNKDEVISREELKSWVLHMFKKIAGAQ